MLYIFAGFSKSGLHAGGLQHAIETVGGLAILEHDPSVQYRKEGVFLVTETGEEWQCDLNYQMSDLCLRDGITWDWFQENWLFGNGVTVHKTLASPQYRTVVHGTDLTLDQFLSHNGITSLSDLDLERVHERHKGWIEYEARWLPGTCPQENHVVHLTWLVTTHRLAPFAYERIRELIEQGAKPKDLHLYSTEHGKHFSEIRRYDGKPAHGGSHALPLS